MLHLSERHDVRIERESNAITLEPTNVPSISTCGSRCIVPFGLPATMDPIAREPKANQHKGIGFGRQMHPKSAVWPISKAGKQSFSKTAYSRPSSGLPNPPIFTLSVSIVTAVLFSTGVGIQDCPRRLGFELEIRGPILGGYCQMSCHR